MDGGDVSDSPVSVHSLTDDAVDQASRDQLRSSKPKTARGVARSKSAMDKRNVQAVVPRCIPPTYGSGDDEAREPCSPAGSDNGSVASLILEPLATGTGNAKKMCARNAKSRATGNADAKAGDDRSPTIPPSTWAKATERGEQIARFGLGTVCVLEVYAGCAHFSGAVAELGMNIFVPVDKDDSRNPWADTDDPAVQAVIMSAIGMGLLWYIHLAPECRLWSRARAKGKASLATGSIWFTSMVLEKVIEYNKCNAKAKSLNPCAPPSIFVSLENPWPSDLFLVSRIARAAETLNLKTVRYDCCAWGATFKKPSQLRTNMDALSALGKLCGDVRPHQHETLEGKVTIEQGGRQVSVWKTSLAGRYVPDFCRAWAKVLRTQAPKGALVRPGASPQNPQWQMWLMETTGHVNHPQAPLPICPTRFSSGWENATCVWSHTQERRGKKPKVLKRPAADKRSKKTQEAKKIGKRHVKKRAEYKCAPQAISKRQEERF